MSGTQTQPQTIDFAEIPSPLGVPGSYMEIVASGQGAGVLPIPSRTLIIGGMCSGGTATGGTLIPNVTRPLDGRGYGGPGSHIDRMVTAYLQPDNLIPLDIICLADAGGAAKAAWTLTFAGTATGSGTPAVGIADTRIFIGTLTGDAAATAATEFAAAINADPTRPVTAAASGAVVTATAKNGGTIGNDISFVPNPSPGDVMPPGLTLTIAQTVQGATNPSISSALTSVATTWYTDICIAWQDSANQELLAAEVERRRNAMVHLDCRGHIGATGTFSQQLSAAASLNERFIYFAPLTAPQSPPWAVAASAAYICAQHLTTDPARQLNQIPMPGILGPLPANRALDTEKQLLLEGGCSIFHTAPNGLMSMERYVSTYTTTPAGNLDQSWMDVMRQAVSARIRYDWNAYYLSIYGTSKLAPDGSLAALSDSTIATPRRVTGSWAGRMTLYADLGWIINEAADIAAAVVYIDPSDRNRLDSKLPFTPIGNAFVNAGQLVMQE